MKIKKIVWLLIFLMSAASSVHADRKITISGGESVTIIAKCGGGTKYHSPKRKVAPPKKCDDCVTQTQFNAYRDSVSYAFLVLNQRVSCVEKDVEILFERTDSLSWLYSGMNEYLYSHPDVLKNTKKMGLTEYEKYLRSCRRANTWGTIINGAAVVLTAGLVNGVMRKLISVEGYVPDGYPQNMAIHSGQTWAPASVHENPRRVGPVAVVGNNGGHSNGTNFGGGHQLDQQGDGGITNGGGRSYGPASRQPVSDYQPRYTQPNQQSYPVQQRWQPSSQPSYSQPVQQYRQPSNYQPAQYRRY